MNEIKIEGVFNYNNYNEIYYNELLRVNKKIMTRWNIKTTLDKLNSLYKIDNKYNSYVFKNNKDIIGFCIISNEDGEDIKCSDIKTKFQIENTNEYWLANFFIYPEFRGEGYGNKCFKIILDLLGNKNKVFYLYTGEFNFARKIYSKYMEEVNIMTHKEGNKVIYRKRFI